MTEQEMMATTCHKTLVPLLNAKGHPGPCLGSACSAWRWSHADMDPSGQPRSTWPDIAKFGPADDLLVRHGYCGLAGKP